MTTEYTDMTESHRVIDDLIAERVLQESMGRVGFSDVLDQLLHELCQRDPLQARKRRRARRVAAYLVRLPGVRFIALANTTALGYARDESDLDFFVIVRAGTIWTSRLLGGLPFRLMGKMPGSVERQDAVCLSYWISDDAFDLSSHALPGDDPYFRYWFLSLLPLFDDGAGSALWAANTWVRARHPSATRWIPPPDLQIHRPCLRVWTPSLFEAAARWAQLRWFPQVITLRMNRDTTVIVSDKALKFHVHDGREEYRERYHQLCLARGISP